jgi:hypothetical protein
MATRAGAARPVRAGLLILITTLLSIPQSVSAQTPWELAAGYAYLQDPPDRLDFPSGWIASAAVGLTSWLSAVADVSRHSHSTLAIDFSTLALVGGVRASARIGRLTEFGQIGVGLARSTSTVVGISSTAHAVAIQPGAGLDYPLGPRFAARLQIDYRAIRGGIEAPIADPRHQFRYAAELVYRGRRR